MTAPSFCDFTLTAAIMISTLTLATAVHGTGQSSPSRAFLAAVVAGLFAFLCFAALFAVPS